MNINGRFIKYFNDENGTVLSKEAEIIPVRSFSGKFSRGSVFLLKDLVYSPRLNKHFDQYYILSSILGSDDLNWMSYSGFHAGERTLIQLSTREVQNRQVDSEILLRVVSEYYTNDASLRFDVNKLFFIDGQLELSRA
jgi:hypothetical protein